MGIELGKSSPHCHILKLGELWWDLARYLFYTCDLKPPSFWRSSSQGSELVLMFAWWVPPILTCDDKRIGGLALVLGMGQILTMLSCCMIVQHSKCVCVCVLQFWSIPTQQRSWKKSSKTWAPDIGLARNEHGSTINYLDQPAVKAVHLRCHGYLTIFDLHWSSCFLAKSSIPCSKIHM